MVAKRLRGMLPEFDKNLQRMEHMIACQVAAIHWAEIFNRELKDGPALRFLDISVLIDDAKKDVISYEEALPTTDFIKYNNNSGKVHLTDAVPQAFSHFTWERSKEAIMVVDLQGCKEKGMYILTDPAIHSVDR